MTYILHLENGIDIMNPVPGDRRQNSLRNAWRFIACLQLCISGISYDPTNPTTESHDLVGPPTSTSECTEKNTIHKYDQLQCIHPLS
jgi:hypothetical protein